MKITFAGLKTTGKVETVWVVLELERITSPNQWTNHTDYIVVWGRRGGKLRTIRINQDYHITLNDKIFIDDYEPRAATLILDRGYAGDAANRIYTKFKKGYKPVKAENLADVYPTFEKDLDKINFWEQLK
jgi:hypothetical protein